MVSFGGSSSGRGGWAGGIGAAVSPRSVAGAGAGTACSAGDLSGQRPGDLGQVLLGHGTCRQQHGLCACRVIVLVQPKGKRRFAGGSTGHGVEHGRFNSGPGPNLHDVKHAVK